MHVYQKWIACIVKRGLNKARMGEWEIGMFFARFPSSFKKLERNCVAEPGVDAIDLLVLSRLGRQRV